MRTSGPLYRPFKGDVHLGGQATAPLLHADEQVAISPCRADGREGIDVKKDICLENDMWVLGIKGSRFLDEHMPLVL